MKHYQVEYITHALNTWFVVVQAETPELAAFIVKQELPGCFLTLNVIEIQHIL